MPCIITSTVIYHKQAAADRELLEETGLKIIRHLFNPYETFFESTYINPASVTRKSKTTTVWAAEVHGDAKVTIQPEEILSYRYVDIEKAHEVLSWADNREAIKRVISLLKTHIQSE